MNAQQPTLRAPTVEDGAAVWQLVRDTGVLDENSPYLYVLMGAHHAATSAVAHLDGKLAGFVLGTRPAADTWFCWQVGVADHARGHGLATRLILDVLGREAQRDVRFLDTTVTPSNAPSRSLFRGLARRLHTPLHVSPGFPAELFPGAHEAEDFLHLGPFDPEVLHAAL